MSENQIEELPAQDDPDPEAVGDEVAPDFDEEEEI